MKIAACLVVGLAAVLAGLVLWPGPTTDSEYVVTWGQQGDGVGEFQYIEDIDLDRDGNLYVVDKNTARVTVFSPVGRVLRSWGGPPLLRAPEGIAIDSQGRVLVGDFSRGMVLKFAADGTLIWETAGELSHPLKQVEFVSVDADDNVWVTDSGNNRIQVFDANGKFVRRFGRGGTGDGEFRNPESVFAHAATNSVYVTDYINGRIQKFDLQGNFLAAWSGPHGLSRPVGVAVHPLTGDVHVTEAGVGRVQVFRPDGSFVQSFGRSGSSVGEFKNLHGIVIDGQGRIFLGDTGNHRIQVLSRMPG